MFHQFLRQLFQEWRWLAWQHLSVFLPSRTMREHQAQFGAGDRHIKQPPLSGLREVMPTDRDKGQTLIAESHEVRRRFSS
jgi:hypothetical protein